MLRGIDVSYANNSINWGEAKKDIDFAILRSTFGSDLPSQTDSQFHQNAAGCKKYNIPFGIYHFAYFVDTATAQEQADFAIRMANEYKEYVKFIALDIEEDSERYATRVGKHPNWTECAIAFMERIKAAGYTPILYSNQSWLTGYLDYEKVKNYKLWYAAPDASAPRYNAVIWQYSWTGKVAGVNGNVDMNYLYDESLIKPTAQKQNTNNKISDKDLFLNTARSYIGKSGYYVCITKLNLGAIYDWCAFSVSSIMKDCNFIGKYIKDVVGGAGDVARNSDEKYGTWFKKGDKVPAAGDLIFFRYASYISPPDKYASSHIGIVESVNGDTITTLEGNVEGYGSNWANTSTFKRKTRYLTSSDVYAFYRPKWETTSTTGTSQSTKTSTTTSSTIDVVYQVYAKGQWLPKVKNLEDYAGLENASIQGIYMQPSKGHLKYRVKLIGNQNYLPWVIDYNDYAGIIGKNIDCLQIELCDCDGYDVEYRVSTTSSSNYLSWVKGYNNSNDDGYAGIKNKAIDKLQIRIIKK